MKPFRRARSPAWLALWGALLMAAGCATFPELDRLPPDPAAVPQSLLPLDQLLVEADRTPRATEPGSQALSARAARLRARASLMRGPVHDPATRDRLGRAIAAGQA